MALFSLPSPIWVSMFCELFISSLLYSLPNGNVAESINYEEQMAAPSGRNQPIWTSQPSAVRYSTKQDPEAHASCPALIQVSWTHETRKTDLQLVKI